MRNRNMLAAPCYCVKGSLMPSSLHHRNCTAQLGSDALYIDVQHQAHCLHVSKCAGPAIALVHKRESWWASASLPDSPVTGARLPHRGSSEGCSGWKKQTSMGVDRKHSPWEKAQWALAWIVASPPWLRNHTLLPGNHTRETGSVPRCSAGMRRCSQE